MRHSSALRQLQILRSSTNPWEGQRCLQCARELQRHQQRRRMHLLPTLSHVDLLKNGYPGFLNRQSVQLAWYDYQQHLLDNLNRLTQGTNDQNEQPLDLSIKYSRNPDKAAAFNYASAAHNNHMFFLTLYQTPRPPPDTFLRAVESKFSSWESLKANMIGNAEAMFGPGYVWLVAQKDTTSPGPMSQLAGMVAGKPQPSPDLALLNTYLAGSPHARAHWRKQDRDMNTEDNDTRPGTTGAQWARDREFATKSFKSPTYGMGANNKLIFNPGAADVEPLLCVSTWEHVWVPQYGIRGKREYLERWWNTVDWVTVESNWHKTKRELKQPVKGQKAF